MTNQNLHIKRILSAMVIMVSLCLLAGCASIRNTDLEADPSGSPGQTLTDSTDLSQSLASTPESDSRNEENLLQTLKISELMPSNQTFLPEIQGVRLDWIEIVNTGEETLSLQGCYLSNQEDNPQLWEFPDVRLRAGERCIVYCDKNLQDDSVILASFSLDRDGGSVILTSPSGERLDAVVYDSVPKNASVCAEGEFCGDSGCAVTFLASPGLENSRDGYEAYLKEYDSPGGLVISEVSAHNRSFATQKNQYYDWIELKNSSDGPILLSDYYLSDDEQEPQKTQLPKKTLQPGETFVVFCSGNGGWTTAVDFHADFSVGGEELLYLTTTNGSRSDEVYVHDIPLNGGMGRLDGEYGFWYFQYPTPGTANTDGYREISASPSSSLKEGVYNGNDCITVSLKGTGDIYYTLDGSVPDEQDSRYSEPFEISETTILRAVCVEKGKMVSAPSSFSYILNENDTLPVTSLVCNPQEMFGVSGVYNSDRAANARCDAQVSFFDNSGDGFTSGCSVELHGARSRSTFKKKSFELKFLSCYDGDLEYDLFQDGNVTKFHSLLLRGGSSAKIETVKDCFVSKLTYDVSPDLYPQDVRYTAVYINGEYYGIYAWREAYSEEYFENHLGVDADDVSLLRAPLEGTNELRQLLDFAVQHGATNQQNYEKISSTLDLSSLAKWFALESFFNNQDLNGNIRYVKTAPDAKWQLILYDLDYCCLDSHPDWQTVLSSYQVGDTLCRKLLLNENFRQILLNECVAMVNKGMTTGHILETYDTLLLPLDEDSVLKDCIRWQESYNDWTLYTNAMRDNLSEPRMKEWLEGLQKLTWATDEQMQELFPDYF